MGVPGKDSEKPKKKPTRSNSPGEVLTLRRIDKNKRRAFTLKESQGVLSMRLRKPIPIAQLNRKRLITKKRNELLELVELVFAR